MADTLVARYQPVGAMHWRLELDGIQTAAFTEASGIASEHAVVEYRASGSMGNICYKLRGNSSFGNIVLRRGLCPDRQLHNWRQSVETMGLLGNRKNGSLKFFSYDHDSPTVLVQYDFTNAWPCKFKGPAANASATVFAVEEIELCIDSMMRVTP